MTQKAGSLSCYYCTVTAESWTSFVRPTWLDSYLPFDPTWHWPWGSQLVGAPAVTRGSLTPHHVAHMFSCQQSTNIDFAIDNMPQIHTWTLAIKIRDLETRLWHSEVVKFMWITRQNLVHTSQRTQHVAVTNANRVNLLTGIMTVYYESYKIRVCCVGVNLFYC